MLALAVVLIAAKAPVPPPAHCEEGHLVLQATYGDIVVGEKDIALRDTKPVPKAAKVPEPPRERTLELKVSDTRAFSIDASGWSLKNGDDVKSLEMPKSAKSADVRSFGVSGKHAWIAGQYWLAHVDLETGDVVSGKLARDGRTTTVLDVSDSLVLHNGDRVYKCGAADAVCAGNGAPAIHTGAQRCRSVRISVRER